MSNLPEDAVHDLEPTPKPSTATLGFIDRPVSIGMTSTEWIALILSLVWIIGVTVFFLGIGLPQGTAVNRLQFVITMMAVFMPVALIWVAASAARSARVMREEAERLSQSIEGMRKAYLTETQTRGAIVQPSVERKLEEIASSTRQAETALATFASTRPKGIPQPDRPALPPADQASLSLADAAPVDLPVETEDFIRALNFPENAEDQHGFAAMRRALKNRKSAELIRSAQEVLTFLAQEGIYTDDLRPDRPRPEMWRRFAAGERGRAISGLGGVRDRSSQALSSARMKSDPVFRDTVHMFLTRFVDALVTLEPQASDAELSALGDTRSGRAFMLLGRVTGMFT